MAGLGIGAWISSGDYWTSTQSEQYSDLSGVEPRGSIRCSRCDRIERRQAWFRLDAKDTLPLMLKGLIDSSGRATEITRQMATKLTARLGRLPLIPQRHDGINLCSAARWNESG